MVSSLKKDSVNIIKTEVETKQSNDSTNQNDTGYVVEGIKSGFRNLVRRHWGIDYHKMEILMQGGRKITEIKRRRIPTVTGRS